MRLQLTLAGAVLATFFATSAAKADPTPGTDWGRVLSDLDAVSRKGADVLDRPRCTPAGCQTDTNATAAAPERGQRANVQDTANDWLGVRPTVSLVARDWGSSFRVAGDRLALVDALRLTSSTRMVLSRVRMSDARISPFAQVGLGQWRTDPYLLPLTPSYTEIAAQAAAGVEMRLKGTWQVALETATTVLYRERGGSDMPAPHMWSTTIASRVDF
jgi:opacity protein-like surface antigen